MTTAFARQLATLLVLLSAAIPLHAQTQVAGFELQSINAELGHIIKARYIGATPADVSLIMESLHCELEPDRYVEDPDPRRRRIIEYSRKRNEQTRGDRHFGGTAIDARRLQQGAWFIWRVTKVPRAVTTCTLKVLECRIPWKSVDECTHSEPLTLLPLAAPVKTDAAHRFQLESTVYRMRDIHEDNDIYVQLHEVANVGTQPMWIDLIPARQIVSGCEVSPVKLRDGLDGEVSIPRLEPGTRTYLSSAFRITGKAAATCPITTTFLQIWGDDKGEPRGDEAVSTSSTLEPEGAEVAYVELPEDIQFE